MNTTLENSGFRISLLNIGVICVFGAAWAATLWPSYSSLALWFACLVVIGEIVLIYRVAQKMAATRRAAGKDLNSGEDCVAIESALIPPQNVFLNYAEEVSGIHDALWLHRTVNYRKLVRTMSPSLSREVYRSLSLLTWEEHLLPREVEQWNLRRFSEGVFNVEAGIFDIQYANGHANIVVLDDSKVTVVGGSEQKGDLIQNEGQIFLHSPSWH